MLPKILITIFIVKQQNEKTFWNKKKNTKIPKRSPAYQADVSCFNADILYSFNPELQLTNGESSVRNKLKDLLN